MFFWKKDRTKNFTRLSKSQREELARDLLDEGNRHLEKGKVEAARDNFRDLIRLEPQDPDHRRRLADCQGRLGDKNAELEARCKAATLYAEAGFLLKGIAMCKLALQIDPTHRETLEQLAVLNERTGRPTTPEPPPVAFSHEEEKTRKDEALAEARARVERVLADRMRKTAAKKAAAKRASRKLAEEGPTSPTPVSRPPQVPENPETRASEASPEPAPETAPPHSLSLSDGAPLSEVSLSSVLSRPEPSATVPSLDLSDLPDDDIFIAPLDEDDYELALSVAEPAESSAAPAASPSELASVLRRVPLLSDLKPETFMALVDQVGFRELSPGEVLFEVGSPADTMFCIVEGEVSASLPGHDGRALELARLGEGEFFGEIGLLAEQPRGATIAATKPTMLLVFERNIVSELSRAEPDFVKVLLRFVRERLVASLIATNPLFAPFAGAEAADLTRRFLFLEIKARKPLIRQGTPSGGVFILLTGSVRVVRSEDGKARLLGRLGPGEIFGEMSLINRQDAVASVITNEKSFVLELPASDFTELVMMHPALLAYLSSLSAEREAQNTALLSGRGDYTAESIDIL